MTFLVSVALFATLSSTDTSSLGRDFHVGYKGWNGLSEFKRLADDLGCPLQTRRSLDWSNLDGQDVLVIVHPETDVSAEAARAFLSAGGRLVLADDYGNSAPVLSALGIQRMANSFPAETKFYRPQQNLPLAFPTRATPLGKSSRELLANHASYFSTGWPATFSFAPGAALVVEGTVGHGRFVAVSDASIFINNMLEFAGNREFAAHLIVDMCRLHQDRMLVVSGVFPQFGVPPAFLPGAPTTHSGHAVFDLWNRALGGANQHIQQALKGRHDAGDLTVVVMAGLFFCAASVLLLLRYLPLPLQPADDGFARPPKSPDTGLFSSVNRYAKGQDLGFWGFSYPAMLIREEFFFRISRYLPKQLADGEVLSPETVREALLHHVSHRAGELGHQLWKRVQTLRDDNSPNHRPWRTRVSSRQFGQLYALAKAIFSEIDEQAKV